jgi:hypothetical protein
LSSTTDLAELHHLIGSLRRCVGNLKARYGDAPSMRRIVNDTERILNDVELLEIDAAELELAAHSVVSHGEKIAVPDTEYSRDFWAGVDDEGVGGHGRSR